MPAAGRPRCCGHLAGGLTEIGSRHEADACAGYATTLDAIVDQR